MAEIYNAVIRDGMRIVARVNLTDPKNIPWWWEINDGLGKEIVGTELLEGVIDPAKPLHIVKRKSFGELRSAVDRVKLGMREPEFTVMIPVKGELVELKVTESNTVQDLLWMVSREKGVREPYLRRLAIHDTTLWEKLDWTLGQLGLNDKNNCLKILLKKSQDPASIPSASFQIRVQTLSAMIITLRVMPSTTVGELKATIEELEGIPVDDQRLQYCLNNLDDDSRTLSECNIVGESASTPLLRLESGFERGNSEGNRVTGIENVGNIEDFWRTFGNGLNLKGHCENRKCKSRVDKPRSVLVSLGMPTITLTPSTTYKCSACKKFTFKPDNFIVSKALCTFQYKLTGNRVLQSITVGKDALHTKCIEVEDPVNQQEYDYVKITAMPLKYSTHDCFMCCKWIGVLEDDMTSTLKGCVHHWHKTCYTGVDCPVCLAPVISETATKSACTVKQVCVANPIKAGEI